MSPVRSYDAEEITDFLTKCLLVQSPPPARLTNLTGHPQVVLPNGFTQEGTPTSISFVGKLFGEGEALAVAKFYQDATDFHLRYPSLES